MWLPKGRYEFEFAHEAAWRISRMRLVVTEEIGDRALVDKARGKVKRNV